MRSVLATVLTVASVLVFSAAVAVEPSAAEAVTAGQACERGLDCPAPVDAEAERVALAPTAVQAGFFPPGAPAATVRLTPEALAPLVWRPEFARAKSRLDAGRPADALAAIAGVEPRERPERYLHALALQRAGRSAEAAEKLVALAADYPELADHCYFLAAAAYEATGELSAAAGAYDAVEAGSSLAADAQMGLARVLRRLGDARGALAVLKPMSSRPAPAWGFDAPAEALFTSAELLEGLGEKAAAAEAYLELWSTHPRARPAAASLQRARSLGREPSAEQQVARGELLMEAHRNDEAVALLQPIVETPPASLSEAGLCRARFALGKAFRKQRRHPQALAMLRAVADGCAHDETWARALYVAGTSAGYIDRPAGIELYTRLADELPDHPFADDALFFAADLLGREGRPDEARRLLKRLALLHPGGDYRAEGLFKLYWLDRRDGRLDEGLETLGRLVRDYAESDDPAIVERAEYWQARTLVQLGRREEGLAAYERLALGHPASFYAMLARQRLAELDQARAMSLSRTLEERHERRHEPAVIELLRLDGNRRLRAALELRRLGFADQAADELMRVERAPLRGARPAHDLRALTLLLAEMGETRLAHVVARTELKRELSGPLEPELFALWKTAYPRSFRETIEARAGEAGIDPDLLQGLIREESAFDPRAGSWAGAMGLCQLMMPTAKEVAGWLKVKGPITRSRLHEPDLNVQLGSTYLAHLIKRFDGNLALAVASYNAGGGAVSRWRREAAGLELDEFLEEIPVDETRNYVKRVLGSYSAYQLVWGKAAGSTSVARR